MSVHYGIRVLCQHKEIEANVGHIFPELMQKPNKNLMEIVQFRFIVCNLAFQRIQLHFGIPNLYKLKSSLSSTLQLTIA